MQPEYRNKGKEALATVLNNPQNIKTIELAVYKETTDEDNYLLAIYQIVGGDMTTKDGKSPKKTPLNPLLKSIRDGEIGWKHECYKEMALRMIEKDAFVSDGIVVEEGVVQCQKCKSWRVHSTAVNNRSGDEGTSVMAQCINCKTSWLEKG